jgi:hypothetical protein
MNDATRIEKAYRLPRWVRGVAQQRLAAMATVRARLNEARDDVAELLRHVRAICGDEDARAWVLAIGIDKVTLRKVWSKSGSRKRERIA